MFAEVIVNNYMLGSKVKSTPVHKIVSRERIDSKHTRIVYSDVNQKEVESIERILSKRVSIINK